MAMAQDLELLRTLIAQEETKLQRLKESGKGMEHPDFQEAVQQLETLKKAMEHPAVESEDPVLEETVVSEKEYDPPPREPNMAAPDMAVPGQREWLDARDPRFRATQDRDVSRNLGGLDAEEDIAQVRAKLAQQQRSPTAVHGGSDNLNARFGPGSPLGATPDDLPWDRPTQTDPDAPPTGIRPGDRPIRRPGDIGSKTGGTPSWERTSTMKGSAPGEGFWTGHIYTPRMEERVKEALAGRGYYGDKIKGRNLSPDRVKALIEQGDIAQRQRSRGSRASLKEDHALAARARSQGLGLEPPELYETTQEGGDKVTRGSRAHLTQARRQEQQQRAFLRANQGRGGLRGSLMGDEGGDSGFDPVLYQNLLRTDPKAAADYRAKTAATRATNRRSDAESARAQSEREATKDYRDKDLDIKERRLKQTDPDAPPRPGSAQALAESQARRKEKASEKQDERASYLDTSSLVDPAQRSIEGEDSMYNWNAGVTEYDDAAWKRVVAMRTNSEVDAPSQEAIWDKQAYDQLTSLARGREKWTEPLQDNGAEQFADWVMLGESKGDPEKLRLHRESLGLPKWFTRTHAVMLYGHANTGDVYNKDDFPHEGVPSWLRAVTPGLWPGAAGAIHGSTPEDWDKTIK
jgi:hypothetical protein